MRFQSDARRPLPGQAGDGPGDREFQRVDDAALARAIGPA
jgi:hypothetical protein